MKVYAHYNHEKNKKQLLEDHLVIVAENSFEQAKGIHQQDVMYLIGLFHDLGKSDPLFQKMMLNQTKDFVNHSSAGATYLSRQIPQLLKEKSHQIDARLMQLFLEIVGYVITAHHGLYDIPCDLPNRGNSTLCKRLFFHEDKNYSYDTVVEDFAKELESKTLTAKGDSLSKLVERAFENFCDLWSTIESDQKNENDFYVSIIVRLYLSILKNADILDTINAFEQVITPPSISENKALIVSYASKIENTYKRFPTPKTNINKIRMELSDEILSRGRHDETGIYRLNLPTGAGKTNLSMRYGFHQLLEKEKERFFYITPYLSVLEQNASEIKKITGVEGVLEHHSNIVDPEESEQAEQADDSLKNRTNYLVETWDSPIVLSTMVQFFQTLFKGKSANIRRFSQLMNSVIILDEVQSLPVEVTTIFNLMMNFLKKVMKTTIVLCTATQPKYNSQSIRHRIEYGNRLGERSELVELTEKQRSAFERTTISKMSEGNEVVTVEDIFNEIQRHSDQSILVILNTKSAVKKLFELVTELPRSSYHLSTNMCAKHRFDIIAEIKKKLKKEQNHSEPLICISTQLIEAGVDLDFDCVIRSYAGIDSIVQAAGRCNREGKKETGIVKLANVSNDEESLVHLPSMKQKREVTEQILRNKQSPIAIMELNDEFFERYYANVKPDIFDYPIEKGDTVFSLLSDNQKSHLINSFYLKQSFKTAAEEMDLIQEESKGVLVYYDEEGKQKVNQLIDDLNTYSETYQSEILKKIKDQLKKLQPYTVNLRRGNSSQEAITSYLEGTIQILQEDFYHKDVGVVDQMNNVYYELV